MRYLSVCSGIEAATVAWHPLGWEAAAYSEIEPFPRAVLQHHYPSTPLHGDFTTIGGDEYGPVELLVGGTPCQSFSVAGLRGGMDDPRGNLALGFLQLARRTRARWLVWENVPGVLSSNGGRDFGSILGGLAQLGYGWAYRVLDAQFFGVAQRRRRVFVVGHLGDWRRAAAVLFERHSLQGHPSPRREAGQSAPTIPSRSSAGGGLGTDFDCDGGLIAPELAFALNAHGGPQGRIDAESETFIAFALRGREGGAMPELAGDTVSTIRGASGGSSRDYVAFDLAQITSAANRTRAEPGLPTSTLSKQSDMHVAIPLLEIGKGTTSRGEGPNGSGLGSDGDPMFTLQAGAQHGVGTMSAVRRLTPRECERLQGFPDDYTLIPWRKGEAPDGPRYKALGNSMAVPVMAWIGRRIAAVEAMTAEQRAAA